MPELPKLDPIAENPVTIILLAYNEEPHLEAIVQLWLEHVHERNKGDEILLIDDGSTDRTRELAEALAEKEPGVQYIRHLTHRGMGASLRSGFEKAQWPLLVVSLCQPDYKPEALPEFLKEINRVHFVTGYRAARPMPFLLRGLGWLYRVFLVVLLSLKKKPLPGFLGLHGHFASWAARICFGVRLVDVACPYFVIRKEILEHAPLQSDGSFGMIELMAKVNYLKGLFAEDQVPLAIPPGLGKWSDPAFKVTLKEAKQVFSHPDFRSTVPPKEEPLTSEEETPSDSVPAEEGPLSSEEEK